MNGSIVLLLNAWALEPEDKFKCLSLNPGSTMYNVSILLCKQE